ncbi:glutathione S-transferase family protein [Geminicoccus flavidas]|uniref:glutathione S-transferase family protein n=1 Tax=Geminicoccus flavidas TaxID=2506407 RepID=UPI001357ED38|nr:glutathione S-transferase family protein [Geminicoccus flavidas]
MGQLVDGLWKDQWYDTASTGGEFRRENASFRNWVTADGSPGLSGEGGFAAERGRYHLYVSYACPWAHRTLILRSLKGLDEMIGLSVTHWRMAENGWTFEPGEGVVPDPIMNARYLHELYTRADPHFTGRVTVPLLWDKQRNTIVSNESSEIIRMFNRAFDGVGAKPGDYVPAELETEIDRLNERIYPNVNNGVYRAGFATSQRAYDEAVGPLFETLDWLEERLAGRPYLCGEHLTEADIRLFPTLFRFDTIYVGHFKCNIRRLVEYPRLWAYTRRLYQMEDIRRTTNLTHAKRHYYESHRTINPTGIVPRGPELDFGAPV